MDGFLLSSTAFSSVLPLIGRWCFKINLPRSLAVLVQAVSKAGAVNGEFGLREDDESEWSGVGEEGLQRLLVYARLLGRRMEGERIEAHGYHEFTTKVHASGSLKFYSPATG
ncbi:hypothetical protein ACTXT7_005217 [Hymenolepis weldensis]